MFLGRINTVVLLFVGFVLLIVPVALLLKLLGWDAMRRRRDRQLTSYR